MRLSPDITWPKAYNDEVDFDPSNIFLSSVCLINTTAHKLKSKGHYAHNYSSRMLSKLTIYSKHWGYRAPQGARYPQRPLHERHNNGYLARPLIASEQRFDRSFTVPASLTPPTLGTVATLRCADYNCSGDRRYTQSQLIIIMPDMVIAY